MKEVEKRFNKKIALIGVALLLVLFIFYGIHLKNDKIIEEKKQYESSFTSDKRYGTLKIINIEKTPDHLIADISNITDIAFMGEVVDIVFLSNMGDVLCRSTYTIPEIEAHSTASLNVAMEQECKNAYTFVLEKKEEDKDG